MTDILSKWAAYRKTTHTDYDADLLGDELAVRVSVLEEALKEVHDDCMLRAVRGVVPIGSSAWISICNALQSQ